MCWAACVCGIRKKRNAYAFQKQERVRDLVNRSNEHSVWDYGDGRQGRECPKIVHASESRRDACQQNRQRVSTLQDCDVQENRPHATYDAGHSQLNGVVQIDVLPVARAKWLPYTFSVASGFAGPLPGEVSILQSTGFTRNVMNKCYTQPGETFFIT